MTSARSSSAVLMPERTWVVVSKPTQEAALEVVRMFTARGFPLVDTIPDDRGVTLRFKGHRTESAEAIVTGADVALGVLEAAVEISDAKNNRHHHHHDSGPTIEHYKIGSVFYVRVEPRGETMSSISAIGRPTRSGAEACTADPGLDVPCVKLESGPDVQHEIDGYAEAEMINGVFSEMRVGGIVVAPDLRVAEAKRMTLEENKKCWETRRNREEMAAKVSNPRAKAGILRTAPNCEMPALAAK